MENLIEALTIFMKYGNYEYPIHCEHGILFIRKINPEDVSGEDQNKLDSLGFFISEDENEFCYFT